MISDRRRTLHACEVSLYLPQGEMWSDPHVFSPGRRMESLHPLRSLFVAGRPPFPVSIPELLHRFPRQGIELDTCIVYLPARLFRFDQCEQCVQPRSEPYLEDAGRGGGGSLQPHVDEDMRGLRQGPFDGMIVLVQFGNEESGTSVGSIFNDSFHLSVLYITRFRASCIAFSRMM